MPKCPVTGEETDGSMVRLMVDKGDGTFDDASHLPEDDEKRKRAIYVAVSRSGSMQLDDAVSKALSRDSSNNPARGGPADASRSGGRT